MSEPEPGSPHARPRLRSRARGVPEAAVVLLVAGGLVLVALDYWRTGLAAVGGAFVLGAVLRLLLPPAEVPLLVNRGRAVDVAVLAALGGSVLALAYWLVFEPPFSIG